MEEKNVLVTGVNGNLGNAVRNYFLHQNWRVVGTVRSLVETGDPNPMFVKIEADLTRETVGNNCVQECVSRFGKLNSAVLTVGGFRMGSLENTKENDLKQLLSLNFMTAYNIVRPAFQTMKKQGGGTIFLVGSIPGMDTRKASKTVGYSLSKSLLFQLANVINAEKNETGVKAYVVVPSTIDTPQNRKVVPDADFSQWEKPESIAKIIGKYVDDTTSDQSIILTKENKLV